MNGRELSKWIEIDLGLEDGMGSLVVDAIFLRMTDAVLSGDSVFISGFGTFAVSEKIRNVRHLMGTQLEPIRANADGFLFKKVIHFKPCKELRDVIDPLPIDINLGGDNEEEGG